MSQPKNCWVTKRQLQLQYRQLIQPHLPLPALHILKQKEPLLHKSIFWSSKGETLPQWVAVSLPLCDSLENLSACICSLSLEISRCAGSTGCVTFPVMDDLKSLHSELSLESIPSHHHWECTDKTISYILVENYSTTSKFFPLNTIQTLLPTSFDSLLLHPTKQDVSNV